VSLCIIVGQSATEGFNLTAVLSRCREASAWKDNRLPWLIIIPGLDIRRQIDLDRVASIEFQQRGVWPFSDQQLAEMGTLSG